MFGEGGGGKRKERNREGRDCEKLSNFLCFVIYCLWLYEAAKMLFSQPTDSISRCFVGYMVYWVPVYLHNLQCSVCGGNAIF